MQFSQKINFNFQLILVLHFSTGSWLIKATARYNNIFDAHSKSGGAVTVGDMLLGRGVFSSRSLFAEVAFVEHLKDAFLLSGAGFQ